MPYGLKDKDLKQIINVFHLHSKVKKVLIFGSRAMGTERLGSDIDLAIKGNGITISELLKIKIQLDDLPIAYVCDVVNYNTIKTPEFVEHIDTHGIVFFQREEKPSEWKTYKVADFIEINPRISLKKGEEYSFVEMKDLNSSLRYVTPSTKKELKGGSKFQNGDTLFARITPCLENGKICQVKELENNVGFGSTEFLVFRGKPDISDNDFTYYLSRTNYFRNNAIQMMSGTSGRQRVERSALEELEISVPDVPTQQQIAQILTSLDDKIELNLQMNQTLEAMAQAIFKEWFVDFNFPGFDGELVNGLPKGWRKGSILEIATLLSGGTPKTGIDEYWNGSINWISAKDITNSNNQFIIETEKTITELGIKKSAAKLLPKFTTIISARGTVGNYCILSREMAISQSNYGLKSISDDDYFLFLMVENMILMMKAFSYGTVFDTITTKTFQEMEVIIPNENIIKEFEKLIAPCYKKILSNQFQIQSLSRTRDTLLPKLMNGQLELKK